MTNRSLYGAWGGGDSKGDIALPGNHGGGYGAQTAHFFKMHDGSGLAITDAKTNVTSGTAAHLTWDTNNGAVIGSNTLSVPPFTLTDPIAGEDFLFIGVLEFISSGYSYGLGGTGFSTGFRINELSGLVFKNSTGTVTFAVTKSIPINTPLAIYIYIDDSAATLTWGWVSATDSSHEAAAAFAGGSATAFTDTINLLFGEHYSIFYGLYPESAPSLPLFKEAAAWQLAQHTSDICKADPTQRIIYPGLL